MIPIGFSCAQTDAAAPATTPAAPQPIALKKEAPPRALWVWNAGVITQAAQRTRFFNFCETKKIGVLYLTLGDLVDATKRSAEDPRHVTPDILGDFIETAHTKGLRVEALDGDPHFTLTVEHEKALKRLEGVLAYNRAAAPSSRLDGFQWDIEPYVLKEFQDKAQHDAIVVQFLDIIKKSTDMVQAAKDVDGAKGFWLGFALPFWMDGEEQAVTWNSEKKPATFHALEILSSLPHGYVAMMAYRDKADGDNGTIAVVRGELDYAAKHAPAVQVVIGQETGKVETDPTSITFYEEGEGPLEIALGQIEKAYQSSPVYGGVAIHHLDSYEDLIARLPQASAAPKGAASLTLLTPKEGSQADLNTTVSGKAAGGSQVQLSIKPAGDMWYDSQPIGIGGDGSWATTARLGNDTTKAGLAFAIRVRLLDDKGAVLQEKQVSVVRQ